ncbi:MAG: GNAT family N-acetyltransferase [Candidatus Bipolaricaulaceae bacterium]
MAELRLREFRFSDLASVLHIAQASFPEELALWGISRTRARALFCLYELLRIVQKFRGRPFFKFYIAEQGTTVVAGAMVEWRERYAYVQAVMVHPEFRGRGIGRALVSFVVDQAFRFGAERVVLHVHQSNAPARRLYEGLGFRPFEERLILVWEEKVVRPGEDWPTGSCLLRVSSGDRRRWAVIAACQDPGTIQIYGPPKPSGRLEHFLQNLLSSEKSWLLLDPQDRAVAELSVRLGNPVRLDVHVLPDQRGKGWEKALLSWALTQYKDRRFILRTNAANLALVRAALELGFRQKAQEIGMVLEKRA